MNQKFFIIVLLFFNLFSKDQSFSESFILSCDFSPQGRYARGYPPYLAQKAKSSLKQLEDSLSGSGLHINERIIISGYEQNAVPSYKFDIVNKKINDESNIKSESSGWSYAPGNLFGFITGFLFKDCNNLHQKNKIFEHINPESVELFEADTELFQRHAFGQTYSDLNDFKCFVNRYIQSSEGKKLLKVLKEFWSWIYSNGKKSRQGGIIATQDILFSILYSSYLMDSTIGISKFFIGPDITYPIRVLESQALEATRNSQKFVERFMQELTPRNGKKTGYVFCSFVDGVGKSTLLGNIVNWLKFSKNFKAYESVNNSSSQLSTLYPVNEDVFILDLPAQMSHFCAKPEGHVFVDIKFCKLDPNFLKSLLIYLERDCPQIIDSFMQEFSNVKNSEVKDSNSFCEKYLKNVINLGVEPKWIPFEFENENFVFNLQNPSEIRMLISFDEAHSSGLKVQEPELMIFEGATIPMSYNSFLDDLVLKMKMSGIEEVVFVDFISMYPRSSRENVRINFMLQQLRAIFKQEFDINKSLYRNFAHNHEIYPVLKKFKDEVINSVVLETLARTALNDAILFEITSNVKKLSFEGLIEFMNKRVSLLSLDEKKKMFALVEAKVENTLKDVEYFKFGKIVESCWNNDFDKIAKFSDEFIKICTQSLQVPSLQAEWSGLQEIESVDIISKNVIFKGGCKGVILAKILPDLHDPVKLNSIFNALRLTHFITLSEVLASNDPEAILPALILKKYDNSYLLIQKFNGKSYMPLSKLETICSYKKEFLFGYDPDDLYNFLVILLLDAHSKYEAANENKADFFVSTSEIVSLLDKFQLWQEVVSSLSKNIRPSVFASEPHKVQLILRALATQESIFKVSKMDIMARSNSREDFSATLKLLENITLPAYFGIKVKNSLFESYDMVEPIIELDFSTDNYNK
jgi:hypothetical protein